MDRRLVPVSELVTVDVIAERLRMSVNTASNVATGRDGRYKHKFPRPLVGRGVRGVWLWTEVEAWWIAVAPKTVEARRRAGKRSNVPYKQPSWSHGKKSA